MSYNPPPSQQRAVASDPRHGKARGEVIESRPGAGPLRQVMMVLAVLGSVAAGFLVLAVLLTEDANRSPWLLYSAYGALALLSLVAVLSVVRRRLGRRDLESLRSRSE